MPHSGFTFGASADSSDIPGELLLATQGIDDTRMDLTQFDDAGVVGGARSGPATPRTRSPPTISITEAPSTTAQEEAEDDTGVEETEAPDAEQSNASQQQQQDTSEV